VAGLEPQQEDPCLAMVEVDALPRSLPQVWDGGVARPNFRETQIWGS